MSTSCTINPGHQVQQPVALAKHQLLPSINTPQPCTGSTGYSRCEPVQSAHIKINDAMKTAKDPRNATRPLIYIYYIGSSCCYTRMCTRQVLHRCYVACGTNTLRRRLTLVQGRTKGLWLASMAITTCYYCPAPKSPYVRRVSNNNQSNSNNNLAKINLSATATSSI